jgi:ATP-dependent Clp protease ATP-binding subunit ClpC
MSPAVQPDEAGDDAGRAIAQAEVEARTRNHGYIGTEHVLLGILKVATGVSQFLLSRQGVTYDVVSQSVDKQVSRGETFQVGHLPISERVKTMLEAASDAARELGSPVVQCEHLLIGIVREGTGVGAGILRSRHVTAEGIMAELSSSQPRVRTDADKTPTLNQFTRDLTSLALQRKLDPVIGREKETVRLQQVLCRRTKSNPCLIGEPGVGKTAIVEGLAIAIASRAVPEQLLDKRLLSLDVAGMLAGTKYRGEYEERVKKVLAEIRDAGDVLVFIDEIHNLIKAGGIGDMMKPALARGEMNCIGATTLDEFHKYIETDAALERRFQPILVEEPTVQQTIDMLEGVRARYEGHHHVQVTPEAMAAAARLSHRYLKGQLPDIAIDLIDEGCARVRMQKQMLPADLQAERREIARLNDLAVVAAAAGHHEEVQALHGQVEGLSTIYETRRTAWREEMAQMKLTLTEETIAELIQLRTGVAVGELMGNEAERLLQMETELHARMVGQEEAVSAVSRAVRRSRAGLRDVKRPIGSFLFLGPTGVGKTELARCLAKFLFHDEDALIRLDMSEFMEPHSAARLVGSPLGYVGSDEGGQLTEAVRRKPYSVVLFDEIEKAHPEVINLLLQILGEEGCLSDAKGKTVSFANTIVIMTSNLGQSIDTPKDHGFQGVAAQTDQAEAVRETGRSLTGAKGFFRPELLNRLDAQVVFQHLTRENLDQIVTQLVAPVAERLAAREVDLVVEPPVLERLCEMGYSPEFGARGLRRVIQREIENEVADALLANSRVPSGSVMRFQLEDGVIRGRLTGGVTVPLLPPPPPPPPAPPRVVAAPALGR